MAIEASVGLTYAARVISTVTGGDAGDAGDVHGWVLLVTGPSDVHAIALPARGELVIGRDPTCDVALDHERVSRRHARIVVGKAWTVEDLGSRNGTQVRGASVAVGQAAEICTGEAITVGPFTVVILPRAVSAARTVLGGSHVSVDDPTLTEPGPLVISVARSAVNIVVTGETGSGKEVLTRALHRLSGRTGPLLAVNCAALAPALLESELFGHERGAFTGAVTAKVGLLEAAAGGTVLFDEIGEMPLELQAKLLRAIETREVLRVGAVRPSAIDVRFVAATHRDLAAASTTGEFRRDLFYRLAGITLSVPPLRERRPQIAVLAARFAHEVTGRADSLGPAALARLAAHDWPGNVRELRNVIERAVLLAAGGEIGAQHILLDTSTTRFAPAPAPAPAPASDPVGDLSVEQVAERERIVAALERCAGNQTHAARELAMSRANLVNKLALYRIPRPRSGR